jgi:hypothetical protein
MIFALIRSTIIANEFPTYWEYKRLQPNRGLRLPKMKVVEHEYECVYPPVGGDPD